MKLKIFPSLFIGLLSYSCATFETQNIAPGYIEAYKSLKNYFIGYDEGLITKELISNIPYASSTLRIGRGSLGLTILESIDVNGATWVSSDGVYLVLDQSGKIVKTRGLLNNLIGLESVEFQVKDLISSSSKIFSSISYYSYDQPKLNLLPVTSKYTLLPKETVNLLNQTLELNVVTEEIVNEYLGWKETNKYWMDDSGFVWKSSQSPSPKLPTFYIEVTKKPAN